MLAPSIRICSSVLLLFALSSSAGAQQLEIHHIDVDQGDATLLVMPNGRTLLVDSGLDSRGDEVANFLTSKSISNVDAFLLTHYDADHMGGIDRVVAPATSLSSRR